MIWTVQVFRVFPITVAGVTGLAVSFVSIFVVGFGQAVFSDGGLLMAAWCCVLVTAIVAYILTKPVATAEINEYQQRLSLQLKRSNESVILEFTQVKSIELRKKCIVLKIDSDEYTIRCRVENDAQWLRDWLREQMASPNYKKASSPYFPSFFCLPVFLSANLSTVTKTLSE